MMCLVQVNIPKSETTVSKICDTIAECERWAKSLDNRVSNQFVVLTGNGPSIYVFK